MIGSRQSKNVSCANSVRHVLPENVKVNLKLDKDFAPNNIFLSLPKKNSKIGPNRENRKEIELRTPSESKHDDRVRVNQVILHYERNLQNIEILLLFLRKLRFENCYFLSVSPRK